MSPIRLARSHVIKMAVSITDDAFHIYIEMRPKAKCLSESFPQGCDVDLSVTFLGQLGAQTPYKPC